MKKLVAAAVSASIVLGGCATASKDVATTYVSPMQYQSYDCDQIWAESQRIQNRVFELGGRLDQAAGNDQTIGVAAAFLFWPAIFFLGGTKAQEAEYGRLKGEYDGLQQALITKKCSGVVGAPVQTNTPVTTTSSKSEGAAVNIPQKTSEEKLTELKRLFDAGLISPEVYSARQKVILGG